MADSSDRILKILLQLQADLTGSTQMKGALDELSGKLTNIEKIQAWGNYLATAKQAKTATDDVAKSAFSLEDAFRFAGAEEVLRRVIDVIKEVPTQFAEGIKAGIEFNAELQTIQTQLAGVLLQTQSGKFGDFSGAFTEAGKEVDQLKEKANELGIAYTDLFESFQHVQAVLSSNGVKDFNDQLTLAITLTRALQTAGVSASVAFRDIGDILRGQASIARVGGTAMASLMGFASPQELDQFTQQLQASGTLVQGFTEKLRGIQTTSTQMGQTFQAESARMHNALTDLESAAAQPIMAPLIDAMKSLEELFTSEDLLPAVQNLGSFIAGLVEGFAGLTQAITGSIEKLSQFAAVAGSLTGNPVLGFILGKAGQSQGDLQSANTVNALQQQTEKLIQMVGLAGDLSNKQNDIRAKEEARLALESGIIAAQTKIAGLTGDDKTHAEANLAVLQQTLANFDRYAGAQKQATASVGMQKKTMEEIQKIQDDIAIKNAQASGDKEAEAQLRAKQAYDQTLKVMQEKGVPAAQAIKYAEQERDATLAVVRARNEHKAALQGAKDIQQQITLATREEETLLQRIRQQQQLINQNPFLSTDQKAALSLQSMLSELDQLKSKLQTLQDLKAGPLDPAQLATVNQRIQQTGFEFDLLKLKIAALQQPLLAGLVQWANQFNSITHQASTALTGTLNTAISGTSQALTGLITGTKNWQQAFAQAGASIIQQLIQIALQYVVSKLIMMAIDRATGQSSGAAASTGASQAAAAWAPAATSAAIASEGAAVTTGVSAYLAGLAVGEAAAVGISGGSKAAGFEAGGYTGDAGGIVHAHEYVFNKTAVRNIGLENLQTLHTTAQRAGPSAGSGGGKGALSSPVSIALHDNRQNIAKWMQGREGRKIIVDIVSGARVELGI